MFRNRLSNYSMYVNFLVQDKCVLFKTIRNSSRIILANLCRIRNIEIERYISQNFKHKFNEKKSKFANNFGRILLGATVLSFAEDKISDEEIQEHFEEFYKGIPEITTTILKNENKLIDQIHDETANLGSNSKRFYNSTHQLSHFTSVKLSPEKPEGFIDDSWTQLINSKTVKLWRRPLQSNPRVYEYRLCGTFDNISARSFYKVQTDIEYRKQWDDLIVDLQILHSDMETKTDTIRWVTHFPYPMNDREYIYKRRSCLIQNSENALIISKAIEGKPLENVKNSSSTVRIVDYKSIMYIQSHSTFDKVGMDYFLIYYDDPKTNFPSAAVSWMSTAGIPSFIEKVHKASLVLEEQSAGKIDDFINDKYSFCGDTNYNSSEYQNELHENMSDESPYSYFTRELIYNNSNFFNPKDNTFANEPKSQ